MRPKAISANEALTAVATVLGQGLKETATPPAAGYIELAELIRYEHVPRA